MSNFRNTKAYDLLFALPLIGWYVLAVWRDSPQFLLQIQVILQGNAGLLQILRLISIVGSIAFSGLLIVLLLERNAAVGRLSGIMPRVCAFVGTFAVSGFLFFRALDLPFWLQLIASVLVVSGLILSIMIVYRLGTSFSIMPEARQLVTTGPYAFVRHPLYMAEELVVIGMVIQYPQPYALLLGLGHAFLQYQRTVYEERVLVRTFPEYKEYQAKTWRFLPGVI